ncbi:hypothetical protein BHE74_00056934, partial [Ensete ventricosum]
EFRSIFCASSRNFKILAIPNTLALGKSDISKVLRKNMTVINFAQCHAESRVSIDFSCTVTKFQNIGHSQHINPWEVV